MLKRLLAAAALAAIAITPATVDYALARQEPASDPVPADPKGFEEARYKDATCDFYYSRGSVFFCTASIVQAAPQVALTFRGGGDYWGWYGGFDSAGLSFNAIDRAAKKPPNQVAGITLNGIDRAPKKPANQVAGIALNGLDRAPKKQENRTDRLALGFYRDGDFGMFWGNNGHASYDNGADTGKDAEAVAIAGISFNLLD